MRHTQSNSVGKSNIFPRESTGNSSEGSLYCQNAVSSSGWLMDSFVVGTASDIVGLMLRCPDAEASILSVTLREGRKE